ncbi:nucleotidyltransferase substrate binding protein (TIGR01987 family) [Dysgonomonadaceae bacterium PH5-43]|nr:nucleotidyltransferase substrate binding protein (TIGR01987 family) [Dysgonomonadaceae bacterium PH5-43]
MTITEEDIRWEQRFSSFRKALIKFNEAVEILKKDDDNEISSSVKEILKEGLIQRFEYTHELAWKTMKDYIAYQGNSDIKGSRDATREAFKIELINDGETWMDMISSRNKTSHTYNDTTATEIYDKIVDEYYAAFNRFMETMEELRSGKQGEIFTKELL